MGEAILVGARFLQLAGVLVITGSSLFFLYGMKITPATATRAEPWQRSLLVLATACALAGTVAWILAETALVGVGWQDALHPANVWTLASETRFGRAAFARVAMLAATLLMLLVFTRLRALWVTVSMLGVAASATFAWTGHGAMDRGPAGLIHLGADLAHLLCAGVWLGALAPLAILAWRSQRSPSKANVGDTLFGLVRFSSMGIAVVALLTVTGLVNSWFLIGPAHWQALLTQPYGLTLTVKIGLFGLMLVLAARNRKMMHVDDDDAPALHALRSALWGESLLALALLLAVALLGTLTPPVSLD
jgi:putative copper resistance protein D